MYSPFATTRAANTQTTSVRSTHPPNGGAPGNNVRSGTTANSSAANHPSVAA